MTHSLTPALWGYISWDGAKPLRAKAPKDSVQSKFKHGVIQQNKRQMDSKLAFHFAQNQAGATQQVASFGRICHWPDISQTELQNRNQAQIIAQNFNPDLTFLSKLAGDFAAVFWDEASQTLTLIRDHLGTRPLFYLRSKDRLFFASDIQSLLPFSADPDALYEPKVHEFLNAQQDGSPDRTMIADIFQVPPATALRLMQHGQNSVTYWHPDDVPVLRLGSEKAYVEHGQALLKQAIIERIPPQSVLGLHISGGLDSTTIAAVATDHCRAAGLSTPVGMSWQPVVDPANEPSYDQVLINYCADTFGIQVHGAGIDADDVKHLMAQDPATANVTSDLLLEIGAQNQIASLDCPLVLSGWGGDQSLSIAGRSWKRAALPQALHRLWTRLRYGAPPPITSYSKNTDGLVEAHEKRLRKTHGQSVRDSQIAMLTAGTVQHRMTCWSMYFAPHNVQHAFPLLDRRLVEFALGIPARHYVGPRYKRHFMRQLMKGLAPNRIRLRLDKNEPARFDNSKAAMADFAPTLAQMVKDASENNPRCDHLNMDKLHADLDKAATGESRLSGKLFRAAAFVLNGQVRTPSKGPNP